MTADLTPVQQLQTEMGVEFYEWDGWPWPSNFGNPVEEYLAPRNGVGIVENSGLRKWELRGPDALRAADYIVDPGLLGHAGRARPLHAGLQRGGDGPRRHHRLPPRARAGDARLRAALQRGSFPLCLGRIRRRARADERRARRRADPGPALAGRRRACHGCRSRPAPVLPLRRNGRRRGGVHPVAHRVQRRARLRDLRLARSRGQGLDRAPRGRRGTTGSARTGSRRPTTSAWSPRSSS